MVTIYQTVEVEFDSSELDEDETVDACREFGYIVFKPDPEKTPTEIEKTPTEIEKDLAELCEYYRKKDPGIMEKLRAFLQNYTGRVLP